MRGCAEHGDCQSCYDHVLNIYPHFSNTGSWICEEKIRRKRIRNRKKIVEFRKQRKETRTDSVFKNLPFSTAYISVIQFQTLETYVEKYNKHNFAIDECDI